MKQLTLIILTSWLAYSSVAQTGSSIDVAAPGGSNTDGIVRFNNPSALGDKTVASVDNDEIRGNPYWKPEWNKAYIFLSSGELVKVYKAKFNFYDNNIYFIESNKTIKIADAEIVNKIMFIDKDDSLKTMAVFEKLKYNGTNSFFQVLNAGDYQLLKLTSAAVKKSDYNALTGKDDYSYEMKAAYYVIHHGVISQVPVLNKDHLASAVSLLPEDNSWLSDNKNKLRSEQEIVSFFNYYNSKH